MVSLVSAPPTTVPAGMAPCVWADPLLATVLRSPRWPAVAIGTLGDRTGTGRLNA